MIASSRRQLHDENFISPIQRRLGPALQQPDSDYKNHRAFAPNIDSPQWWAYGLTQSCSTYPHGLNTNFGLANFKHYTPAIADGAPIPEAQVRQRSAKIKPIVIISRVVQSCDCNLWRRSYPAADSRVHATLNIIIMRQ